MNGHRVLHGSYLPFVISISYPPFKFVQKIFEKGG